MDRVIKNNNKKEIAMNIVIKDKNIDLRSNVKEYLEKKLAKIQKHFSNVNEIVATFAKYKNTFIVEITLTGDNLLLRSEDKNNKGFKEAIDEAVDKLDAQIKKFKGKKFGKKKVYGSAIKEQAKEDIIAGNTEIAPEVADPGIVKVKKFTMKPITLDEAIEAMELVGHTFYFFQNIDNGLYCVVYKRDDGDYGLIEPSK